MARNAEAVWQEVESTAGAQTVSSSAQGWGGILARCSSAKHLPESVSPFLSPILRVHVWSTPFLFTGSSLKSFHSALTNYYKLGDLTTQMHSLTVFSRSQKSGKAPFSRLNPSICRLRSLLEALGENPTPVHSGCPQNSVLCTCSQRFLFLLARNWGIFPVHRDHCLTWFLSPLSQSWKPATGGPLHTRSLLPSLTSSSTIEDWWFNWAHPTDPKSSPYLKVPTLSHICKIPWPGQGTYS